MWEKEERGERLKETEGRQKKTEGVKEVTLGKFHRGGVGGVGGGEPTTSTICTKRKIPQSPVYELFQ